MRPYFYNEAIVGVQVTLLKMISHLRNRSLLLLFLTIALCYAQGVEPRNLELSRPARPWEFLCATSQRAGLFGNESGNFEAWVYPLKLFRNFHVRFLTNGRSLPAETLVRTVTVRPESSTIHYASDDFSVDETLFVPIHEPGAVVIFQVETVHPLEIEVPFERDFQLEWPAGLGATYVNWTPDLRAFYFGEETRKFSALVGSPSASVSGEEYQTNYSASQESTLRLGATTKGNETKVVVIAGSVNGRGEAEATYKHLLNDYAGLQKGAAQYYRDYLSRTVQLELPDPQLQQAYDWARVSAIQGLVTNPYLGSGLVAGYRTSGISQRPGFAWFFGRDSFWTTLALDAEGDFATSRTAIEFISKYQRADGRIPHEIAQGASFVNWFNDYPYPYASVDATPLYIIATNDYVSESGDVKFAREKWDSLWKAYQFLRSTYDSHGLPQNYGLGHGWVEGGPLLPVNSEFYQSGLGAQAIFALSKLAHMTGKDDLSKQLADEFLKQKQLVNEAFWSAESGAYAFALDRNNQKVIEPSVLATVPMWFGLLDAEKAGSMIDKLAAPEHLADWGMRIISSKATRYDPSGYHYGSVWPLFTGWASVGEYRYHHALPAYANLRANSSLALDGSLGHLTEVLSGDFYQPLSTSSPYQIWSAAMVISPMLRGLLGLETDASEHRLIFAPHIPAEWKSFSVRNVRAADATVDLSYQRAPDEITLEIDSHGTIQMEFSPALSPRAHVVSAEMNGRRVPFQIENNPTDLHAIVRTSLLPGKSTLRLKFRNDFAVSYSHALPPLGSTSRDLRIISEAWNGTHDELTLEIAGIAGSQYQLDIRNPEQIRSVDGAELKHNNLVVSLPPRDPPVYEPHKVILHFASAKRM
jgi:glycogen debranching enzyme